MKRRKEGVGESEEGARESVLSDDPPDSKYLFISQEIHSDSEYPFISQEIYPDSKYSFISQNYSFLLDTMLMYISYFLYLCGKFLNEFWLQNVQWFQSYSTLKIV